MKPYDNPFWAFEQRRREEEKKKTANKTLDWNFVRQGASNDYNSQFTLRLILRLETNHLFTLFIILLSELVSKGRGDF